MKNQGVKRSNKFAIALLSLAVGGILLASSSLYVARAEESENIDNYSIVDEYSYDISSSYIGFKVDAYGLNAEAYRLSSTVHYVYTDKGSKVTAYKVKQVFTDDEVIEYNSKKDNEYPNAQRIGDSSLQYNCHSYAWYQQSTSNPYWIDEPEAYFTDGSYVETKNPQVADRVAYFNKWDRIEHSAVIVSIGNSNDISSIKVESKWGAAGLYRHNIFYCSYMAENGGNATYVKFYTHATHDYSGRCENYDELKHKIYCKCGAYKLSSHYVKAENATGRYANCVGCGARLDLYNHYYPGIMKKKPEQYAI